MPGPNDYIGLNISANIGGLINKSGINGDTYTDENGRLYSIDSQGNLDYVLGSNKLKPIDFFEQNKIGGLIRPKNNTDTQVDEFSNLAEEGGDSGSKFGNWMKSNSNAISGVLGAAGSLTDNLVQNSLRGNQGAFVSSAFSGNNEIYDTAKGFNAAISATDFDQAKAQNQNMIKKLNQLKTKQLSGGQAAGMVGAGALKGASLGMQVAGPWGGLIGGVVGAGVGGAKAASTNNKISDANLALKQKRMEVNNYMNRAMMDIKSQQMKRAKQDYWNNSTYQHSLGGYLYANGGLMNPYGINEFNTGGSHSQNAFGGIPVSIAEDGKPNLVEEGEVLYDDYVYSNRIKINDTIRRRLKLKDDVKTFADAAKEVKERGDDRPNDPVTEHTIKAHMQILKSEQEKKKEQQEAREQQKMIAQMNEQQLQTMQEQQMNQQADAYEQQMAQQQMAQQQQMQMPEEQKIAQDVPQGQQPMFAKGGNLQGGSNDADAHRFKQTITSDKTKKKANDTLNEDISDYVVGLIQQIQDNEELSDEQKKEAYDELFNSINEYQISHSGLRNQPLSPKSEAVKKLQDTFKKFGVDINDAIIGRNFNVEEGGTTGDKASENWVSDGYMGNQTLARTLGYQLSDEQISKVQQALKNAGVKNWDFKNNFSDKAKDYSGFVKTESPTYKSGIDEIPNYSWKYRQNYIPLGIDAALAAQSFAPADYSRANSIINTPIRDIQYKPIGGKIAPYIIDPRLQYQMNADLGAATNRGLINNAGGNGAAAQAALLANNRQISQSAANLGYQADAQNAAQIQAAQQFNSNIDQINSNGFLEAARANQAADVQRGEFNYYGQNMKENIDAKRGEAISNSMQSLADDSMKLSKDRYNQGMMAGLVDSGYFGEATPFIRQMAGFTPTGEVTTRNYLLDDYGNRHYIINNAGEYSFENPNDDLMKQNVGKTLVFENGKYKFV